MKARLEVAAGHAPAYPGRFGRRATHRRNWRPPLDYTLQPGDPIIFDVVPRLNGYWGDNAATYFVGEPRLKWPKLMRWCYDTLRQGLI